MPHTTTTPGGFCPTTSAWVMRTDLGSEPRLLVHLHRRYGRLMQPGGHVERDEDAWTAICHELAEETGYDVADLSVLQPLDLPVLDEVTSVVTPTPLLQGRHCVEPDVPLWHWDSVFAFHADGPPRGEVAAGESTDLRWLTLAELRAAPEAIRDAPQLAAVALEALRTWRRVPASMFRPRG